MGDGKAERKLHRGVHVRPLLTPYEAQALLAALDGETLEGERLDGLDRAKAKLGRVAKGA